MAKKTTKTTGKKAAPKAASIDTTLGFGEYNGHKLIVLGDAQARFPVQFGAKKARLILEVIKKHGIKAFEKAVENIEA